MAARTHAVRDVLATPEPLATPDQVSEFLGGIPLKTLAKWRSEGTGPEYTKIGRHARYDWADVRSWLAKQRAAARA